MNLPTSNPPPTEPVANDEQVRQLRAWTEGLVNKFELCEFVLNRLDHEIAERKDIEEANRVLKMALADEKARADAAEKIKVHNYNQAVALDERCTDLKACLDHEIAERKMVEHDRDLLIDHINQTTIRTAALHSQLAAERERSERRRRLLAHHQYEVLGGAGALLCIRCKEPINFPHSKTCDLAAEIADTKGRN